MLRSRQYVIFFFTIFLFFLLLVRLFYLQIISYDRFQELASEQHNQVLKLEPRRGAIYDRFQEPLAINIDRASIYADPRNVTDKDYTAEKLSEVLGSSKEVLLERFNRDKGFVWVKRKVDPDQESAVKNLKLKGIYFLPESQRNYPNERLASHIIGFAGMDNFGLEGLELKFNDELKGKPGFRHLIRDAKARPVLDDYKNSYPAQNGYNIVLTIDSVIQYIVEEEIEKMAKKFNASSASCVVMDPVTGKILAMANYPDYNLNELSQATGSLTKNNSISSVFEPGSVFKIVTAGAALEEDIIELDDKIYCEKGNYKVGGRILHDFHAYGDLTFEEVITKSSNIGTVKVAQKLGEASVYEYVKRFGFGEKTEVDLLGEVPGISRPPSVWSRSDITTIPIGQGIAVTPIQLAAGISVIANGGLLMRPYVVDYITTWEGEIYEQNSPLIKRRVLSEETSGKMRNILREVVVSGTGRKVKSKKYTICGKTGTAQMVNPNGGYYDNKYNATFIGFAPKEEPLISMIVTARDPHPIHFGGNVAGPTFKNIAEKTLQYLESNKKKDLEIEKIE